MEPVPTSIPRLTGLVAGLLLLASSCQSDPSILEQALDPGTAVPTEAPSPTALSSPTPSEVSNEGPESTEAPTPTEMPTPTVTPTPTEVSDPTGGFGGSVHYVPSVVSPLPEDSRLEGQPFAPSGAMPAAIIASTEECDIVSVDSQTGVVRVLADFSAYRGKASVFDSCSEQGLEYQEYTGTAEIAPGFIEDVEWASPKYVLIGNCCEPAVGRFEVLDIEKHVQPYRLSLDGSYPSISDRGELLFISGAGLGIAPFEVSYNDSDPSYPSYQQVGDVSYHTLALDDGGEGALNRTNVLYRTTWVADSVIAVGIFTARGEPGWLPWVAVIDLDSGPVAANARGEGWMLPTGDQLGNLVVAEQLCFVIYISQCIGSSAKVVVVESETLDPLYEIEVDDTIVDMDLERGWLLVTLVDGRMGTLDLSDGTFNFLADGIRNAVWQE